MMRLSAIALWTRGHLIGADADVMRVTIDTRKVQAGDLASAVRAQSNVRVIGITGSNGKTTDSAGFRVDLVVDEVHLAQELVKTISLRQLFNDTVGPQVGFDDWGGPTLSRC